MSYAALVAEAINLWPMQDLSGGAVDVNGGSPLAGAGGLVYGVSGPAAWLPSAISIPVANAVLSTSGIPGAVGLVGYTLGFWCRANVVSPGFYRMLNATIASPIFVRGSVFESVVPWGSFVSTLDALSDAWIYLTIGRSSSGLTSWVSVGDIRENFTSTAVPMVGLPLQLGFSDSPPMRSFAQMALWARPLALGEVSSMMAGPSALAVRSRVRGSGRGRRIGNVR